MPITQLEIRSVRIIQAAKLELDPGWNFIVGPNGSGKTSLLEALAFVASGRSFRTHRSTDLISKHRESLRISVRRRLNGVEAPSITAERTRSGVFFELGGKPVQGTSQIARELAVVALTPAAHALIEGGPRERRRYLDWLMFHVERSYLELWQRYHRALRHRNALLRHKADRSMDVWERELEAHGSALQSQRRSGLTWLAAAFGQLAEALGLQDASLAYQPGCPADQPLADVLRKHRDRDASLGYTSHGPHRDDLRILASGKVAAGYWSRGQGKLGAAALALAQVQVIKSIAAKPTLLLIDDFGAELDSGHRQRLFDLVGRAEDQVVATTTDLQEIPRGEAGVVFHVEHGDFHDRV